MRLRTLFGLVAMCALTLTLLLAAPASAYQLLEPDGRSTAPGASTSAAGVSAMGVAVTPCPTVSTPVGGPLPKLGAALRSGLAAYAKNPSRWDAETWMDSGGAFGGGVPASAVRTLMRGALAAGLTDEQVSSFLEPGFLRGMNDPRGGPALFDFIGEQHDPVFLAELASYTTGLDGRSLDTTSAQADVFGAIPLLRAAYMAQAGAIPPDLETAQQMLSLANQGYGPAQRTVQAFLAGGNHPSAGAENAGGVADGMLAPIYDLFVASYAGPLSPAAAAAVANRVAYLAWAERIATWADGGAAIDAVPEPASFPAPLTSTTSPEVPVPAC